MTVAKNVTVSSAYHAMPESVSRHVLMKFFIRAATQCLGNNRDRTFIIEKPCTVLTAAKYFNDHPLVIDHCSEFYRAAFL